jgi:hypothetical protein
MEHVTFMVLAANGKQQAICCPATECGAREGPGYRNHRLSRIVQRGGW